MHLQDEHPVQCPYCGEAVTLLVDHTGGDQTYIEDCFVCCRPMVVLVHAGPSTVDVRVQREDD